MVAQSRRRFLQFGSLGAVAVGAALTPGMASGAAAAEPVAARQPNAAGMPVAAGSLPDGPFMAYVKDHRSGEVVVMIGEREVVYRDPELAGRLARIASHA